MYRKFKTSGMSIKTVKYNTQVGGKINHPGQLAPTPATKSMRPKAQFDLNYDYRWYNFMYRKFETSEMSIKKK